MLLLLACAQDSVPLQGEGADPAPTEQLGGVGEGCPDVFDPDTLLEVELTTDEWEGLVDDYESHDGSKPYHPATFTLGGTTVDASVRLKGNEGFSWVGDKMQFVVSFVEDDPDARFGGVRKLSFDAPWYDPTLLRERVAMSFFADAGLPYSCTSSARLVVNGAYYGVYALIEYLDHQYVERHFGEDADDGGLWKYGTEQVGEEGGDRSEVRNFFRARTVARMSALADEDEMVAEWAAEAVVGDGDGYWCCSHNFYLYEHPTRGILFLPWDLDLSLDAMGPLYDPIQGGAAQYGAWIADDAGRAAYVDAVGAMTEAYDVEALQARVDAWDALLVDAWAEDPHRTGSIDEHADMVARLRRTIPARKAYLESWVAAEQGGRDDADQDGARVGGDCDDGAADVYPGATETCDGRDEDCDGRVDEDAGCDTCVERAFEDARFLWCEDDMSWVDAAALCTAHGATLGAPDGDQEALLLALHGYYTTTDSLLWAGAAAANERCYTWDVWSYAWELRACDETHEVLCRL